MSNVSNFGVAKGGRRSGFWRLVWVQSFLYPFNLLMTGVSIACHRVLMLDVGRSFVSSSMQVNNRYYYWMIYGLCLLFGAGCTSDISECPAFSEFVGKTFTLNKAQSLWLDQTSESVYEITNIGEKPRSEHMKMLVALPVGTSLRVEKVQRTVGLLGFPWDYAIVQVVIPATNQKKLTAQKLLNYDYQNPFGGHQSVIHSKQGTGTPCIDR